MEKQEWRSRIISGWESFYLDKNKSKARSDKIKVKLSKKIKCVQTGIVFDSEKQASEIMGVTTSKINDVLKGRRKSHSGYSWEYL